MNRIQYISVTHIDQDMAKENKAQTNYLHTTYYKEATFDEVADLLDDGCSIGRVGNTTEFLSMDIDKTTVNISRAREHFKDNKDYRISYSSSYKKSDNKSDNEVFKYHILVNIHRTITRDNYKEEAQKEFEKIRIQLCKNDDEMILDKNANGFYQCFFGPSTVTKSEYILKGSKRLWCWTKKDYEPKFYKEKEFKDRPSLNSADYCKKNGLLTVKEEKRFDIKLPSMTRGKMELIPEGDRFNWSRMIGTKLIMRLIYLNHYFNESWTKFDLLDTFGWIVKKNVVNFDEFKSDYKKLSFWLDDRWNECSKMKYEDAVKMLELYFKCSKRQYKSRKYNPTVMKELIDEHRFDANTILFTDKEELQKICKELMLNYYKFIKFAESDNCKVAFECISDKRIKYNVEGMTLEEFHEYCTTNHINKVTKSRLKKKYNIR